MKLPANYSAISAGEMHYLDGGRWELNLLFGNVVTFVGNSYIERILNGTLGVLFSPNYGMANAIRYKDGSLSKYTVSGMVKAYFGGNSLGLTSAGYNHIIGPNYTDADSKFVKAVKWNAQVLGLAAAIYQMGTVKSQPVISSAPLGVNGTKVTA